MNKMSLGFAILMAGSVSCFAASTDNTSNMNNPGNTANTTATSNTGNTANTGNGARTSLRAHWLCTTNASSSNSTSDKSADDKMSKSNMSAKDAFKFASKHCRDCTKITCEAGNSNQ